jgi:outer membrane immunogenic protein
MKAPIAAPPFVYDWSGFYIGGHLGWAQHSTDGNFAPVNPAFGWDTADHSVGIGGVHVGFNYQIASWVWGAEATWSGTFNNSFGSTVGNGLAGPCGFVAVVQACQARLTNIWTVGPKLGYTGGPWMAYVTGGFARTHIDSQGLIIAGAVPFSQSSNDHNGWFIGGGFDYMVMPNVIVGVDYKHYDFRSAPHTALIAGDSRVISASADSVTGRVSFKFGGWGPVRAAY